MTSKKRENDLSEIKVPIFCEWTFEKNLSAEGSTFFHYVNGLTDGRQQSAYFTSPKYALPGFPGISYYILIYMEDPLWIDFEVTTKYSKYTIDADFTCTLTDFEPKHFVHTFSNETDDDTVTNFEMFMCLDDCVGCSICTAKKIVIRVEGIFTVKSTPVLSFLINISDEIRELRHEKIDTKDFVIVAEEQEVRVHKSVLAENSTVFARMFDSNNWKETMENRIVIPDFSFDTVKFVIYACYGRFTALTNKEEYLMVFQFADKYDIEQLNKAIKEKIVLTPHNVVEYANFFSENGIIELVNACIDYIFSCSQYCIPIKDVDLLDAQIRGMFFDRAFLCQALKKDLKLANRSFNYDEKNDKSQ